VDSSYVKLKALRAQESQLREQISVEKANSSIRDQEEEGLRAGLHELSRREAEAAKQVADQQEKEQRAKKALDRGQKQLRRSISAGGGDVEGKGRGESPSTGDGVAGQGAEADGGSSCSSSGLGEEVVMRLVGRDARVEEKDFCIAELKETTRMMLLELKALAAAHEGEIAA
jgi:hypothetical protein